MKSFRSQIESFITGTSGNVALTFALASLPLVGFIGSAIDFSRANAAKAAMQAAVDSTALALSKDADSLTAAQITSKATAYFNSIFHRADTKSIVITGTYTKKGGSKIVVNGSAAIDTTFMGALASSISPSVSVRLLLGASTNSAWLSRSM